MNPETAKPPRLALPWERIDTVLLDMDGTLIDLYFDNHFFMEHLPRRWAEARGVPYEAAQAELQLRGQAVHGTLDWYCLDFWQHELGVDIIALKTEIGHLVNWRPHAPAFLEALRAGGKRRVLATNAHPGSIGFKFERVALGDRFEAQYSAHELGAPKEHAAFWDRLQAQEGFDPARTLLVDDNAQVLAAARDWGIGELLGIQRPDSRRPANDLTGFTAVHDFDSVEPPPAGGPPTDERG
jgi:putative hydrolase of the HAD superfamily